MSQALALRNPASDQTYVPTTVSARDVNDKEFEVTLTDIDEVTPSTRPGDVQVSYPPDNSDGFFIVAMDSLIFCKRGPGFPEVKKHKIKINHDDQEITVILHKAKKGSWMETWRSLR